jgi:uncharacterized protein YfaP (DUF2135 family)
METDMTTQHPLSSRALASTALAVLLAGCSGGGSTDKYSFTSLEPEAFITPTAIDFGDVIVPYTAESSFRVQNVGRSDLALYEIYLTSDDGRVFSVDFAGTEAEPVLLEVDEQLDVPVTFAPDIYEDFTGSLVVISDDPETPQTYIPLSGSGVDGPVPDLSADPGALDFGLVEIGTSANLQLDFVNEGGGDILVESATLTGSSAFDISLDLTGETIYGFEAKTSLVTYTPTNDAGDNATLTLLTNDPTNPELTVFMLGNGGGDFQYPDAEIDCPDRVNPPTAVSLDGRASTDPMNPSGELLYEWTVLATPDGSSTTDVIDPGKAFTTLFADLAGSYTVQLVVENEVGLRSEPDVCQFDAIPPKNLHIELIWDTGDSDLDLHLIQGGYELFQMPGDCTYCNPSPAWEGGDPTLALDDRTGYGPENINIDAPADGDYDVWVHYFDDKGGGASIATVRVWMNGELAWEGSELMSGRDAWHVGFVRWTHPEGTFNELASEPERWEGRTTCYSP